MAAISSTVGKDENSSGVWMNSAVIRISTEKTIEIGQQQVEQQRRQRQDEDHDDPHDADGEADIGRAQRLG